MLVKAVICTCELNVCSHWGLVEESQVLFMNMSTICGKNQSQECYTCMVQFLGHATHLESAPAIMMILCKGGFLKSAKILWWCCSQIVMSLESQEGYWTRLRATMCHVDYVDCWLGSTGSWQTCFRLYWTHVAWGHPSRCRGLICTLKVCAIIGATNKGRQSHDEIAR